MFLRLGSNRASLGVYKNENCTEIFNSATLADVERRRADEFKNLYTDDGRETIFNILSSVDRKLNDYARKMEAEEDETSLRDDNSS